MREERGTIAGPLVVHEEFTLWGSVGGDVIVVEGGKFYMRGSIYGNLIVEYGGRVHIFGNITGNLKVARGTKVIHSGTIVGDAINEGGRLYIDATAVINGKTKTLKGETKVEPKQIVPGARRRGEDKS
jgi:cytoskeletal protein CcmA (bactofilin family)